MNAPTHLGRWHRDGLNVVWTDGHATWEDFDSLNVDANSDTRYDYWHRQQ